MRSTVRPLFFGALVAWPILTGIPAFVGARITSIVLERLSGARGGT